MSGGGSGGLGGVGSCYSAPPGPCLGLLMRPEESKTNNTPSFSLSQRLKKREEEEEGAGGGRGWVFGRKKQG